MCKYAYACVCVCVLFLAQRKHERQHACTCFWFKCPDTDLRLTPLDSRHHKGMSCLFGMNICNGKCVHVWVFSTMNAGYDLPVCACTCVCLYTDYCMCGYFWSQAVINVCTCVYVCTWQMFYTELTIPSSAAGVTTSLVSPLAAK